MTIGGDWKAKDQMRVLSCGISWEAWGMHKCIWNLRDGQDRDGRYGTIISEVVMYRLSVAGSKQGGRGSDDVSRAR